MTLTDSSLTDGSLTVPAVGESQKVRTELGLPAVPSSSIPRTDRVAGSLDAAVEHLRSIQHPEGWWKGDLDTNVTMDAEDLLLRAFLGNLTPELAAASARWIRSQQREDGTWATFHGGPADLSTTVEAWVALRLAGDKPDAPHMALATRFIIANGGVEATRVFTRIWLALFGLWSWDDLPNMPPEIMFLPSWAPLNIYNWGCWARQTIVPLSIVSTLKPVRPLKFGIDELRTGVFRPERKSIRTIAGVFQRLEKALHAYGRQKFRPLRKLAMRRGVEWILARQEADGGWGGIQPPWVYSLLALNLMGYAMDHPAVKAAFDGLDGFTLITDSSEGPVRRLEACQSPVWDTGLALAALLDGGVRPSDPAVLRASEWLLKEQISVGGDWQVRRPGLPSGGWAFEFANDQYPDTDDTAEIIMALRRVRYPKPTVMGPALDRAIAWSAGMQSKDGGWGAFDADNTSTLANQLPFADFGAVIDPPSADVTAHMVEMLATEGRGRGARAQRGVKWLLDHQETDGSWFGRWGANYVYGTGAVVPALVATGITPDDPRIQAAVRWLESHQNADGGWGEDLRSYRDPAWAGRGDSTASQTAWALLALIAADPTVKRESLLRGIDYLVSTQRADGTWDEELFTGTGFPADFYINYHLYRLVFPIWALGRFVARRS